MKDLADVKALKETDEKNFNAAVSGKTKFDWTGINRLVTGDLAMSGFYQAHQLYGVTPAQIMMALKNPTLPYNWRILVVLSNFLYNTSGHYKRLIDYFADASCFAWDLDVAIKNESEIDASQFKKKYEELLFLLEKMNLPHELNKIMHVVMREGVYYGYIYEDSKDFFINKLDMSVCRSIEVQDGVFNVEINLSAINENNFETFPPEAQVAWRDMLESKLADIDARNPFVGFAQTVIPQNSTSAPNIGVYPQVNVPMAGIWFPLDPKRAICIRVDETQQATIPMFIYLFQYVLDIESFRDLNRVHGELENYRIIALKIPLQDNATEADSFAVSDDVVLDSVTVATSVTDKNIAILPTPLEPEAIKFEQKSNDKDNVEGSVQQFDNAAGINNQLFNGGNSASLLMSLENDAGVIYKIQLQIERFFNRRHKLMGLNSKNYKFILKFLPMTIYNRDKVVDRFLKMCQSGLPMKTKLGAAIGLSPARLMGSDFLENVVFQLGERWKPLTTSYTQSGDGRPSKNIEDLSDEGVATRENDGNNVDSRAYRRKGDSA